MKLLYNLLQVGCFASALTLAIIAPFFPPMAEQQGLSTETIGLILSANPLGAVISSLLLGHFLNKNNRTRVLITGLSLQAIGLFMFIWTEHLSNNWLLIVTMVARIVQGVGVSAFCVPAFSYIPLLYPDQIEVRISQLEACTGVGYIVGPLIGSLLYQIAGYKAPFVFFSILMVCGIPVLYIAIRMQIVTMKGLKELMREPSEQEFNYFELFKNIQLALTCFIAMFSTFSYMYFEPVQAEYFIVKYDITQDETGYLMTISTITYVIGTIAFGQLRWNPKKMIITGLTLTGISFLFQGPDPMFTLMSHNLPVILLFQAILGAASALIFIPAMPLMNTYILEMYPGQYERSGNIASGVFNSAVSAGELLGPLAGGFMTNEFGYVRGASLTGIVIMLLGPLYYITTEKNRQSKSKKVASNDHLELTSVEEL